MLKMLMIFQGKVGKEWEQALTWSDWLGKDYFGQFKFNDCGR